MSTWKFMSLYIISGVGGNLLSAYFLINILSVGASTSVFGMLGGFGAYLTCHWGSLRDTRKNLLVIYCLIVFISFASGMSTEGVDNFGHGGGYVTGLALAVVLIKREEPSSRWVLVQIAGCAFVVVYFIVLSGLLFTMEIDCKDECKMSCNGE